MIVTHPQKAFRTINRECTRLSGFEIVPCRVVPDSIFGYLLFRIFVNDMPQVVNLNLVLYADNFCIMYQQNCFKLCEIQLRYKIQEILIKNLKEKSGQIFRGISRIGQYTKTAVSS